MKSELGKQIAGQAEEAPQPKKGELEKNEKERIKRYVQLNGDNYTLWPDTPEKRHLRKTIACDIVKLMKKKKRELGLE